jgi:hypothetical protein
MVQFGAYWKPPFAIEGQVRVKMVADALGVVPVVSVTTPEVPVPTTAMVGEVPAPVLAATVGAVWRVAPTV